MRVSRPTTRDYRGGADGGGVGRDDQEHNVIVIVPVAHLTHILQPVDTGFALTFKRIFTRHYRRLTRQKGLIERLTGVTTRTETAKQRLIEELRELLQEEHRQGQVDWGSDDEREDERAQAEERRRELDKVDVQAAVTRWQQGRK
jgi:hypothetical protein